MASRYAQPRLTDSAKMQFSQQNMSQDADIRFRWDELRKALVLRYSSPAEAFVAFGGRTDKVLVMGVLDRALREVRERMRTVRPPISIDVEGLMADTIKLFPEGLAFEDFVEYLNWHQAKKPPSPRSRSQANRRSVLRSTAMGTNVINAKPKVMVGAPAKALRASRDIGHNFVGGNLAGGVLSAQWRGSKGPPAHWMVRQRQAASRQAAENVFSDDQKVLRQMKLERKMKVLSDTEERLRAMLEEPTPPIQREEEEKPLVFPMDAEEEEEEEEDLSEAQQHKLSSQGKAIHERLASIDSLVTEQKLSLAETERNILKRERQDLHAQIRQMDALHRQSQMEIQKQMKEQMESLMETFQNVGKVMLGGIQTAQQASAGDIAPRISLEHTRDSSFEAPVRPVPSADASGEDRELSPRALEQREKQERAEREGAFERRIQSELLEPFARSGEPQPRLRRRMAGSGGGVECMIARCRETDDGAMGSGVAQELASHIEAASPAVQCFPESLRPDLGDIRSPDSPALIALQSCCVFVPVCSWYNTDDAGAPNDGSVGRLARMDPVAGEDWADEFLVEVLVALRLEQVFRAHASLGWILPVLLGGESPRGCGAGFAAFPSERLRQLPSCPSLESSKVAAQLLDSLGIPTPERFLRLSVREAVSAVVGFAGVHLDRTPSRSEGVRKLASRAVDMAAAERAAGEAKAEQDAAAVEAEPAKAARRLKQLKRAALEAFEKCYREVREESARSLAMAALRRRGVLGDGDVEAELADDGGEAEEAWMSVSWAEEAEVAEKSDWERFGRHWESLENTLGGEEGGEDLGEKPEEDAAAQEFAGGDEAADIEEVLRRLQAAVVETHDKHSQLLQVTRDSKRLDNLAGGLSEAGREALRESGVTFGDLLELTRKDNGDGGLAFDRAALSKIGMDPKPASPDHDPTDSRNKQSKHDADRVERFIMAPHLWDREGDWETGAGADENERKERLREDLEALQGALKRKSAKAHISSHAVQQLMQDDGTEDGICGVLNSLLFALGKDAGPPDPVPRTRESGKSWTQGVPAAPGNATIQGEISGEDQPTDGTELEDESTAIEEEYLDKGTEEEIGRLDKETQDYLEKLGKEEDAQQEVMQYLASGLAEVPARGEGGGSADAGFGQDLEAGMERKRMEASQMAMEKTMIRFEEAMSKAKRLLGDEHGSGAKHSDIPSGGGAEAGGLTAAENETVKLEEEIRRRAEQAEALAQENMMLREQLQGSRARAGTTLVRKSDADGEGVRIHWSEAIQDAELASKYRDYGDGEDAYYVSGPEQDAGQLDTRFLRPEMLQEVLTTSNGEREQPHLAWGLEKIAALSHITRASVFETVLEERVRKSKKVLQAKADALARELELLLSEEAEANDALERVRAEQAAMVRDSAKAAKGAVVLLKEREAREATARCEEVRSKRLEVEEELERLQAEEEALDWRAELERMREKEQEECDAVRDEIEQIEEAEGGGQTQEGKAKVAELTKKIARIQETWLLRRNLKEKEIEIEVLGQKMDDDEEGLKLEKKRLLSAFQENANNAQQELTHTLLEMEEHVAKTARGRCRPEVMSSLSGVRKVMDAVQRHRAEIATAREAELREEREKLKEERRVEAERVEAEQLEEAMARARKTSDMELRERRLQLVAEAVAKQREAALAKANGLLEDAEKALGAGEADGEAGAPRFERMQLRTVEGGARHARSMASAARKLLVELEGAAAARGAQAAAGNPGEGGGEDAGGAAVQEALERLSVVEKTLEEGEARLGERVREALGQVEALQKLDVGKATRAEVEAAAAAKEEIAGLLGDLGELGRVEEASKVRGRELASREQRLRAGWERAGPRIEEALRKVLARGDACLDSVQAALKAGRVSAAVAELGQAQQAYDKFKAARPAARAPTAGGGADSS